MEAEFLFNRENIYVHCDSVKCKQRVRHWLISTERSSLYKASLLKPQYSILFLLYITVGIGCSVRTPTKRMEQFIHMILQSTITILIRTPFGSIISRTETLTMLK